MELKRRSVQSKWKLAFSLDETRFCFRLNITFSASVFVISLLTNETAMNKAGWSSILVATLVLVFVLAAEAQQPKKIPRIGLLWAGSSSAASPRNEAFREGFRELGYEEPHTIAVEYRYAEGKLERLPNLAAELVRLNVDAIVTGRTPQLLAAKGATTTIPIIMAFAGDPIGQGFIASPRSAREKHHRAFSGCPGVEWKKVRTPKGDRADAQPCSRSVEPSRPRY